MSHSNGKITAPVDLISDIAYVLGESTGDLATLCKNQNVNMWSKIKPLRIDNPSVQISESDPASGQPKWKYMPDYPGGIKVTPVNTASNLAQIYNGLRASCFVYDKPQSGDWCRALDFDGYNHKAISPFGVDLYCPKKVLVGQSVPIYVTERVVNSDSIQMEDMEYSGISFGDMYFGCYFSGSFTCVHTTSTKLVTFQDGQRMLNEVMDVSTTKTTGGLTVGRYTAYPLISLSTFSGYISNSSYMSGTFFNLPQIGSVTFEITDTGYINEGLCVAERINGNQAVRVRIAGTVLQSSSMNFSGMITLCRPDGTSPVLPENVVFTANAGNGQTPTTTYSEYYQLNGTDITQNWYVRYEFNYQNGEYEYMGIIRII